MSIPNLFLILLASLMGVFILITGTATILHIIVANKSKPSKSKDTPHVLTRRERRKEQRNKSPRNNK